MMTGFETALGEITLVLFTTLAPSGVLAHMIMSAVLAFGSIDEELRKRINQCLAIPLVMSMVGLVASATHLGNPANALYVFMGVGRSPLSTEVFFAVVFLMLAGVYWLYSFSRTPRVKLQKVWAALSIIAGIACITAIAFAYETRTIISWNTVYVPLNLWLSALLGGPLVALLSLQVAQADFAAKRFGRILCIISAIALGALTVSLGLQGLEFPTIANSFGSVAELVPYFGLLVAVFFVCSVIAISLYCVALRKGSFPQRWVSIVACVLVLAGVFLTRFVFYMIHMTAGLGL